MTSDTLPTAISPTANSAANAIEASQPYIARVRLVGTADLLFHRWQNEVVAEKSRAPKGSTGKKVDDLETYVYRDDGGFIALPGEYLRQAVIGAAKLRQDPRSPRKSAMDLFKAGVLSLTMLAPLNGGVSARDYEDRRRVTIQRNAITRARPAMKAGWWAEFDLMVALPEYIQPDALLDVVVNAGRLIGVGDFRPTYGRFSVTGFMVG